MVMMMVIIVIIIITIVIIIIIVINPFEVTNSEWNSGSRSMVSSRLKEVRF